ncbi:MAG: DUF5329 family protein [Planctomycetota bacterium]|jgi:hypothetical protein
MNDEERGRLAFGRAIQIMTIVLLCVACVLTVHLTILTNRITRAVDANAENVTKTMATAARISEKGDKLELRVTKWRRTVRADEVASALDEVTKIGDGLGGEGAGPDAKAKAEIAHLLARIRGSGLRFEYDGKRHSSARFYLQMLAKQKAYEKTLASAEDFIANVATRTMTGKSYRVVAADGSKRELADWLAERLREHRAGRE